MIRSMTELTDYFAIVRRRTMNYVRVIPSDRLDWAPQPGEYTCGDIVRHFMGTERMYITLIQTGRWRYPGHDDTQSEDLAALIARMEAQHAAALQAMRAVPDTELFATRPNFMPDSPPIKVWRGVMAMIEHEVHHRSQLAMYLTLMDVAPPQIFGVGVEELIMRATE
jgi:uncharacterized damage-inducible protein DinB